MKKDFSKVFTSNLVKMMATIVATFFLPKILAVDEYAYIKLYQLWSSYIGLFALGFNDGVFLKYGGQALETHLKEIGDEHITFLVYQLGITFVALLFSILSNRFYLAVWAFSILPVNLFTYYIYMYQATGRFDAYSRIVNINSFLVFFSDFVLLFIFKIRDYKAFISLYCISNYVVFVYGLLAFDLRFHVKRGKLRLKVLFSNMTSGVLLMIGNLAYIFFVSLDRWFSKGFLGLKAFAEYSFSGQLLTVINMFITPLSLTLYSYFVRAKDHQFELEIRQSLSVILMGMLIIVYPINFVIAHFISKYTESIPVISTLFMSQIYLTLNTSIFVNLYKVYQRTKTYFIILASICALSVGMNFIGFFALHNNLGFALATFICMVVWTIANMNSFPYLKYRRKEVIYIVLLTILYFSLVKAPAIIGFFSYGIGYFALSLLVTRKSFIRALRFLLPARFFNGSVK